jgi:hypothetical protein
MFFVFDELSNIIYITTSPKSKKMRNIRANPNVSLAVDVRDPSNPFNNMGVMVQGISDSKQLDLKLFNVEFMDNVEIREVYIAFENKYHSLAKQNEEKRPQSTSETLVRIKIKKLVYWRGPKFITVNLEI